jgi:hypothetical protein
MSQMKHTTRRCRQQFGTSKMPGISAFLSLACQQPHKVLATGVDTVADQYPTLVLLDIISSWSAANLRRLTAWTHGPSVQHTLESTTMLYTHICHPGSLRQDIAACAR